MAWPARLADAAGFFKAKSAACAMHAFACSYFIDSKKNRRAANPAGFFA